MKKMLFFVGALLYGVSAHAQGVLTPLFNWSTTSGTQNFFEKNITKTDGSGNVYTAGATLTAAGDYDILLTKTNQGGTILWTKQVDGSAHYHDMATDVYIDASSNVYITGTICNDATLHTTDCITIKYNSSGTQQWLSTYNGSGGSFDGGAKVFEDGTGNVYVCGGSMNTTPNRDFLALKYNSSGVQQWSREYNGTANLDDAAIKCAVSGGALTVLGVSQATTTTYKPLTLSLNLTTGAVISATYSSSSATSMNIVNDVFKDASGNIYLVGGTPVTGHGYDFTTIKLTGSTMALAWEVDYNGASSLDDVGSGIQVDGSGNVYVTGYTTSSTQRRNMMTIKYNSSGTQQWNVTYDDTLHGNDEGNALVLDASANVYVTGYDSTALNNYDYYTVKYNTSGTAIWSIRSDGDAHGDDKATNLVLDGSGAIIVAGQSRKLDNTLEYKVVKYVEKTIVTPTDANSEAPLHTLMYYENKGQLTDTAHNAVPSVRYYTNANSPVMYIEDNGMSMVFEHVDTSHATADTLHRIDLTFNQVGANAKTYPLEESPEYLNYFLSQCPQGITEVHGNQRLVTTDLYSNIDMEYYSNRHGMKYYFIVKPGGSPTAIQMIYTGASSFVLDTTAHTLKINSSVGSITYARPIVYQVNSSNVVVPITTWHADFLTNGASNKYKFNIGAYDNTKDLIIVVDLGSAPHAAAAAIGNLEHSTYYGSTTGDYDWDVRTDGVGNVYTCGWTESNAFPGATGLFTSLHGSTDATVVKFNNLMVRQWGNYFGGSLDETGYSVDVSGGNVHITGTTNSPSASFPKPLSPPAGALNDYTYGGSGATDIFIAKFDVTGTILKWSSYLGGSGAEIPHKLRFDGLGNFYCVGEGTSGSPFKNKTGAYNYTTTGSTGYIAKFNSADTLVWGSLIQSTFRLMGIACNGAGENAIVASTNATGLPIVTPAGGYTQSYAGGSGDVGMIKLDSHDTIYWSSYFGGSGLEYPEAIAMDQFTNIYIGGGSGSAYNTTIPFPKKYSGSQYVDTLLTGSNAFMAEFSKNGKELWGTLYGGTLQTDEVTSIACDTKGNVYFGGYTYSSDFPLKTLTSGYNQTSTFPATWSDGTIVAFNKTQQREWSTFFSGTGHDTPWGIAAYQSSKLYLVGETAVANTSWPLVDLGSGAWYRDTLNNGNTTSTSDDGYIARFDLTPVVILGVTEHGTTGNTSMIVYPNPTNESTILQITLDTQTDVNITVVSTLGQIVYQKQLKNKIGVIQENVDLSGMSDGVYFISVTTDKERISSKVVKQ
ncbi:MAG: DUF7948 domain-containing protein [Bacteroidia bacterium]